MDCNSLSITDLLRIDATTLYYTYSTIAQTLAGAFGIIGAFVLFRLQGLNQSIREFATAAWHNLGRTSQQGDMKIPFKTQNWEGFLAAIEDSALSKRRFESGAETRTLWDFVVEKKDFLRHRESLRRTLKTKGDVMLQLKLVARWTALTIILSLVLLPLSPTLASYARVSILLLGIATGMTINCIRHYMSLISRALTESPGKSSEDG